MKKVFMGMFALATMLLATSCSEDEIVAQSSGNEVTVSFTTELRGDIKTKAVGDGTTVDKLVFAVYEDGEEITELRQNNVTVADKRATVNVVLLKGHTYQFAFWAQASNCSAYNTTDLRNVVVSYNSATNNHEFRDAFFANHELTVNAAQEVAITLKRPFAQLNVGTTKEEWKAALKAANISDESFNGKSSVSFSSSNVADQINLLTGELSQSESLPETITFAQKEMVSEDLVAGGEAYKYLSMSYLLVKDADGKGVKPSKLEDLKAVFDINGKTITFAPSADKEIPIQRNWRTNIIGNILTSGVDFNVIIDEVFSGENNVTDDGNESLGVKVGETYYETIKDALTTEVANGNTNIIVDVSGANVGALSGSTALTTSLVPAGTTVTIRNAVVEGRSYGNDVDGTVIFEGCTFSNPNDAYSIHFDNGDGNVVFKDCNLSGWCSFGRAISSVEMTNCNITGNGLYGMVRFYQNTTMTNCTIDVSDVNTTDQYFDGVSAVAGAVLTMNGCTMVNGGYEYGDDGSYIIVDGKQLVADGVSLNATTGEYEISSAAGMNWFATTVNDGNDFSGKTIKLTANIDLSNVNWTPIGGATIASHPTPTFKGIFDGNNYKISNLTVVSKEAKHATAGLFGTVLNATIQNVTLEDVNILSSHYAGGIVGYSTAESEVIKNCHVIGGTITSVPELINGKYDNGDKVGGIAGFTNLLNSISGCSVKNVTITAYRDLGGIVGYTNDTDENAVSGNTVENVKIVQDNANGYKESVTTYGAVYGSLTYNKPAESNGNNTVTGVTIESINK